MRAVTLLLKMAGIWGEKKYSERIHLHNPETFSSLKYFIIV